MNQLPIVLSRWLSNLTDLRQLDIAECNHQERLNYLLILNRTVVEHSVSFKFDQNNHACDNSLLVLKWCVARKIRLCSIKIFAENGNPHCEFNHLFANHLDSSLIHTVELWQNQCEKNICSDLVNNFATKCPLLTSLHCAEINYDFILNILHRLQVLIYIKARQIDIQSLQLISRNCHNLRFFETTSRHSLSTDDFITLIEQNYFLEHLEASITLLGGNPVDIGLFLLSTTTAHLVSIKIILDGGYNFSFTYFLKFLTQKSTAFKILTVTNYLKNKNCCEFIYNAQQSVKKGFIKNTEFGRVLYLKSVSVTKLDLLNFLRNCPPLRVIQLISLTCVCIDGDFIEILNQYHAVSLKLLTVIKFATLLKVSHLKQLDNFPCLANVELSANSKFGITTKLCESCVFEFLTISTDV
jgi:hypothetical protein